MKQAHSSRIVGKTATYVRIA